MASRCQWPLHPIDRIVVALAAISRENLQGLRETLSQEFIPVLTLREWLDAAIDWELNRRTRICRALHDPRITIREPGQLETSLVALAMLHAQFRDVEGVPDFLDMTADVLCTGINEGVAETLH